MECFHLHKFFSLVEYRPLIMQNSLKVEFDSPSSFLSFIIQT